MKKNTYALYWVSLVNGHVALVVASKYQVTTNLNIQMKTWK